MSVRFERFVFFANQPTLISLFLKCRLLNKDFSVHPDQSLPSKKASKVPVKNSPAVWG
jgi:hypothetical protein